MELVNQEALLRPPRSVNSALGYLPNRHCTRSNEPDAPVFSGLFRATID